MDPQSVDDVAPVLQALANPARLRLLIALQTPRRLSELSLEPARPQSWGSEGRAMSRQAVRKHLRTLMDFGVVQTVTDEPNEVRYVVDHSRLFEITEQMRTLATIKSTLHVPKETEPLRTAAHAPSAEGPHLVVVRGVREGQVFPLLGPKLDGWLIGRAEGSDIRLDYDPYVSHAHTRVLLRDDAHFVMDMPGNRNGTFLNWKPMTRGGVAPLGPGDLIGVGMSLLLFRR